MADGFNPFRKVERRPESKPREVWLTPAEGDALVAHAGGYLRPLVLCLLHSGLRRGETLSLAWRNVDIGRRTLTIDAGNAKANRARPVPLTDRLLVCLTALHARRPLRSIEGTDLVFCMDDGSPIPLHVLRRDFARTAATCEGLDGDKRGSLVLHGLRHSFATTAAAAGVSMHALAGLLGHFVMATTARYSQYAPEAQRAAVELLGAALDRGARTRRAATASA